MTAAVSKMLELSVGGKFKKTFMSDLKRADITVADKSKPTLFVKTEVTKHFAKKSEAENKKRRRQSGQRNKNWTVFWRFKLVSLQNSKRDYNKTRKTD